MCLYWKRFALLITVVTSGGFLLSGCSNDSGNPGDLVPGEVVAGNPADPAAADRDSANTDSGSDGSGTERASGADKPADTGTGITETGDTQTAISAGAATAGGSESAGGGTAANKAPTPDQATDRTTEADRGTAAHGGGDSPSGFCEDWPDPAALFAVTGQMHGYLEPCGCSEPQYGGVSRRAALLQQLRDRGWDPLPLDLGGTLKRSRQQSQFKFQSLLSALRTMKYRVLALGEEELRLGGGWLLSQHVTDPDDPAGILSFVSANVVLFDSPDIGTPVPFRIVETGGRRIGITSVIEPALTERIADLADAGITVTDAGKALDRVKAAMQAQSVDLMVLLSHCRLKTSRELARQHPAFSLVFSTGPVEEPYTDNPVRIGETTLIVVGHKGKHVGVAGWYPDAADQPIRFELVKLDGQRFPDPPEMLDLMRFYQDMLKDSNLVETERAVPHRSGAEFVGSEKCGECHTKAFEKWETTGHGRAFESLRKGRRGIPRIFDPECVACHVTGWHPQEILRYESGYLSEKKTPHLLNTGCENCHGPGSRHIELIEQDRSEAASQLMRVTVDQARNSGCNQCHDLDNSPHFDFESYWKKIVHPGLD